MIVSKRINLRVESMAGLEGGGVSIAGTIEIDGVMTEGRVVLDSLSWSKVCTNADWFRTTRPSARVDTLDRRIEELVGRVERDEREIGVLSAGEAIAVAVVLDRRDLVATSFDSWQSALDRLGDEWLAACRRVAERRTR